MKLTALLAKYSSAIRVRDKAIKILQDENRKLALEVAMMKVGKR